MKTLQSSTLLILAALLLSACGGSRENRITEGSEQIGASPVGTRFVASSASIVHVDKSERIATIRRGLTITDGTFLQALDRSGEQTGLLKVRPIKPSGLRTAYILEGDPAVGDSVSKVDAEESSRLKQAYPEADSE
ncbi:MAG: hypothetical protein ACLFS1_10960 [Opitutales bacterium]